MYKSYKVQRYLFFWTAIIVYFIPYIVATACLLPMVKMASGTKWSIGLTVALVNALPFIGGLFRRLFAHVPFINLPSILFLCLAGFFMLDLFRTCAYILLTIEATAAAGSVAACFFWAAHRKYKRQSQTVKTVLKSGLLPVGTP